MTTISRMCPTCRGRQDFRRLDDAEKAAVREDKGDHRHYVHDLWRCTADGCLTYFRYGNMRDRGLLPERFRKEPAAPE